MSDNDRTYTDVGPAISMNNECTFIYLREYSHLKFSSPCFLYLYPIYVVIHFLICLEYKVIIILVLAHVLCDFFAILHVTLLIATLHHETKRAEETITIGLDLFQVETLFSY